MKTIAIIFSIFFIFILSSCNKSKSTSNIASINDISNIDFFGGENILIDVRTPQEYAKNHLNGAINLNVVDTEFNNKIQQLNKNKTYYVYCESGFRSTKATKKMKEDGFKKVINLKDGYIAYKGEIIK